MDSDGSNQKQLTTDKTFDDFPAWSPDGKKIAFSGNCDIWVMNSDGSNKKQLTKEKSVEYPPSWSPDGKKIAFIPTLNRNLLGKSYHCIWMMNSDGSNQTQITKSQCCYPPYPPAWSPDGKNIAFCTSRSIWIVDSDVSNEKQLTKGKDDAYPAWGPDGKKIAFCSYSYDNYDIWVMDYEEYVIYVMQSAISSAQTAIGDANNVSADTSHAQQLLEKAQEAQALGQYQDAINFAKQAEDSAIHAKRIQPIFSAESAIIAANNIGANTSHAQQLLQKAQATYRNNQFQDAITFAKQAEDSANQAKTTRLIQYMALILFISVIIISVIIIHATHAKISERDDVSLSNVRKAGSVINIFFIGSGIVLVFWTVYQGSISNSGAFDSFSFVLGVGLIIFSFAARNVENILGNASLRNAMKASSIMSTLFISTGIFLVFWTVYQRFMSNSGASGIFSFVLGVVLINLSFVAHKTERPIKERPKEVTLLAILYLIIGSINSIIICIWLIVPSVFVIHRFSFTSISSQGVCFCGVIIIISTIICFITGWGLWRLHRWARIVALILGVTWMPFIYPPTLILFLIRDPFLMPFCIFVYLLLGSLFIFEAGAITEYIKYLSKPEVKAAFQPAPFRPETRKYPTTDKNIDIYTPTPKQLGTVTSVSNIEEVGKYAECPYCGSNIRETFYELGGIVRCDKCGAFHHKECFEFYGNKCGSSSCKLRDA